jgi:hypothetical protein
MHTKTFITVAALAGAGLFASGAAQAQDLNSDFDRMANEHSDASHGVMIGFHAPLGVFRSAKAAAPRLSVDLVNSTAVEQSYVSLASYSFAKAPLSARFGSPFLLRAGEGGAANYDMAFAVGGGLVIAALILANRHNQSNTET